MNNTMKPARYVGKRQGSRNWQYARPVPDMLQGTPDPLNDGKPLGKYIKRSLRTGDLLQANLAADTLTVQYNTVFHPTVIDLSEPDTLEAVARQLYAKILQADDDRRIKGQPVSPTDVMMAGFYQRALAGKAPLETAAETGYMQATGSKNLAALSADDSCDADDLPTTYLVQADSSDNLAAFPCENLCNYDPVTDTHDNSRLVPVVCPYTEGH
ncbi:hypothetical protein JHS3_08440 [Jeongeupia sp. HS-3]|uniref:hypothetical protein n=1 Tax=Jeongeupia sp. HS-3 TaxID=1009682 RepID=UPI0018A61586|nr:hypothetical protein [Jeongeupia sp. HS-3]BCL75108.1 hypothetical protein JHS3_08440 [Jeongeupia sp. HS-3]